VNTFASSQPPFERFCFVFYTPVLCKELKDSEDDVLVSSPYKRFDHIFDNHPRLSFNLLTTVHLMSLILVLYLQFPVYYMHTTVVKFPLILYLFVP